MTSPEAERRTLLVRGTRVNRLEAARADPELLVLYGSEFIGPRRANVFRVVDAAVRKGEVSKSDVDIDFVCDLLLGPILSRALMPSGSPLDDHLAEQTTEAVLRSLNARSS